MGQIKGYSPSLTCAHLIAQAAMVEVNAQSRSWFTRVPSVANVADPASRLDPAGVREVLPTATEVPAVLPGWFARPCGTALNIAAAKELLGW